MSDAPQFQKQDTAQVWDTVALHYDHEAYWKGLENHANLKELLVHIGDPRGKRVIEVGSGSGFLSMALAERGAVVALLDISKVSLQKAIRQFGAFGLPEPESYRVDALENGLPDETYDIVWNSGVIEHFFDDGKKRLLREMLRITRPGGKVIVLVPNAWCWPFQMVQAWQKLRGTWAYGMEDDMSPRRLKSLCGQIGIRSVEVYAFNAALGWRWVPGVRKLFRSVGLDNPRRHSRRSWMGFVSVLVIQKP